MILKKSIFYILFVTPLIFLQANPFPEISIEELDKAISKGKVVILDVNGERSFRNGHIPGAIEFSSNQKNLKSMLPKDKSTLVVAYCGGPICKTYLRGAKAASAIGFSNIKHLSAGISGWKKAGKKISK